ACRRIAMICASVYLLVFIRILLVHLAEKILLLQPLKSGEDYRLEYIPKKLFLSCWLCALSLGDA
ncbi:MAG: hypothetical protein ACNA7M_15160, partial [Roseovarius sp.]